LGDAHSEGTPASELRKSLEQRRWASFQAGDLAPDGTIFVGAPPDARARTFALPADLAVAMTFNDAAKAVQQLNADKALGHDDWHIPIQEFAATDRFQGEAFGLNMAKKF